MGALVPLQGTRLPSSSCSELVVALHARLRRRIVKVVLAGAGALARFLWPLLTHRVDRLLLRPLVESLLGTKFGRVIPLGALLAARLAAEVQRVRVPHFGKGVGALLLVLAGAGRVLLPLLTLLADGEALRFVAE